MLNFEDRTGPVIDPAPSYPTAHVPTWWRDAKLGFFIHWGIYSVPAYAALTGAPVGPEDAYAQHAYAEWYANTVRIDGSPTAEEHRRRYGAGTSYEDLSDRWLAEGFDADRLVGQLAAAGGRYLIPTAKHHDGFCLWPTDTTPFNSAARGPGRDLIGELAAAARRAELEFGVYYSGAHDWHVSDFPPIRSDRDLFALRRNDEAFARYCAAQLAELIERYHPSVLWNDIDWPDAGKGTQPYALAALLGDFLARPDRVINDRWGIPCHGHLTREYSHVPEVLRQPWEATRGLGLSFGHNAVEDPRSRLTVVELVHLLVEVVAKNGNLLLNVGPDAAGRLPVEQAEVLAGLGGWMERFGWALRGTRPWRFDAPVLAGGSAPLGDSAVLVHGDDLVVFGLHPQTGHVDFPDAGTAAPHWVGGEPLTEDGAVPQPGVRRALVPEQWRGEPAVALRVPGGADGRLDAS